MSMTFTYRVPAVYDPHYPVSLFLGQIERARQLQDLATTERPPYRDVARDRPLEPEALER
jgi:hypothetical protein